MVNEQLEHLLADAADLATLRVASGLGGLVGLLLGEANDENTESVAVSCSDIDVSLDKGLPLADQGVEFIAGHVHAVEVGQDVVALNILSNQTDFSVSKGLVATVQISQVGLKNTTLKLFRSDS